MIGVSRYLHDKMHYLCRGSLGGSCSQSRSLVKGQPYMYKGAKESKHAVCPSMELTGICSWAMKEGVTIDERKNPMTHTPQASRTCASWKTVTNQENQ